MIYLATGIFEGSSMFEMAFRTKELAISFVTMGFPEHLKNIETKGTNIIFKAKENDIIKVSEMCLFDNIKDINMSEFRV
jgi:hypothetical protein